MSRKSDEDPPRSALSYDHAPRRSHLYDPLHQRASASQSFMSAISSDAFKAACVSSPEKHDTSHNAKKSEDEGDNRSPVVERAVGGQREKKNAPLSRGAQTGELGPVTWVDNPFQIGLFHGFAGHLDKMFTEMPDGEDPSDPRALGPEKKVFGLNDLFCT